jgi:pimeloyl-ACP methyl ester carboxylesterase
MTSNRTSGTLDINGGKLYYESQGEGETLILAHAGFVDGGMWDSQFDEFAQHYRVVRYDQRGFGKSDAASSPISRHEELTAVISALGIESAALIGCSQGGTAALDFALTHPEKLWALVLVSATPSGFEMQGEPPAALMEMFGALQQGDMARVADLQVRIWVDGESRSPEQVDSAVRQRAAAMNRVAVENGTFAAADMEPLNPLDPPAALRLSQLDIPVLTVVGALDHPEIARAADVMVEQLPHAEKHVIDGAAHVPNMEHPIEFNRVVLDFLRNAEANRGEPV